MDTCPLCGSDKVRFIDINTYGCPRGDCGLIFSRETYDRFKIIKQKEAKRDKVIRKAITSLHRLKSASVFGDRKNLMKSIDKIVKLLSGQVERKESDDLSQV